jgi:hypothetical protein
VLPNLKHSPLACARGAFFYRIKHKGVGIKHKGVGALYGVSARCASAGLDQSSDQALTPWERRPRRDRARVAPRTALAPRWADLYSRPFCASFFFPFLSGSSRQPGVQPQISRRSATTKHAKSAQGPKPDANLFFPLGTPLPWGHRLPALRAHPPRSLSQGRCRPRRPVTPRAAQSAEARVTPQERCHEQDLGSWRPGR